MNEINNTLGGWSIDEPVLQFIKDHLKEGSTILELGSGYGSKVLAETFEIWSVEHNKKFIDAFTGPNYIFAPLFNGWYNVADLIVFAPPQYDLILVDGPPGVVHNSRHGFINNIEIFKTDCFILFDDINRAGELELFELSKEHFKDRKTAVINNGITGVIYPKNYKND